MRASFRTAEKRTPWAIQALCNGCGPSGLGKLVPDFNSCWARAGDKHDWEYTEGGTLIDMMRADFRFLARLLMCAADANCWKWIYLFPCAVIYFAAVFLFGWFNFHWRWKPRAHEEMLELARKVLAKEE